LDQLNGGAVKALARLGVDDTAIEVTDVGDLAVAHATTTLSATSSHSRHLRLAGDRYYPYYKQ